MMNCKIIEMKGLEKIPCIGLGTWKSDNKQQLIDAVKYAIKEADYVHIDCAPAYHNESIIGEALQELFNSGIKREQIWITSKLWNTQHHPDSVEPAIRNTLADLKLYYLDLYLIHTPTAFKTMGPKEGLFPKDENGKIIIDRSVSILDTWKAMQHVQEIGLTRFVGVSNFNINMLERIKYSGLPLPYVNQVEYHLYMQQDPLRWYCRTNNIIFEGYSPFGSPDSARPGDERADVLGNSHLCQISQELGKTPAQVELRFLQQLEEGCVLIPKSVNPVRIKQNIDLNFDLNSDQMECLKKQQRCLRMLGKPHDGIDEHGDGF